MPAQEMLRRMDSREITEWKAFFIAREERKKPPAQTPAEARAVLGAMTKAGKRRKR